jgi:UDP-MurNAc hydroxylase
MNTLMLFINHEPLCQISKKKVEEMEITFLGHAGFCVETDNAIIIMDPWLSPTGAFDGAWFQFPRNHHLSAYVQEKLRNPHKERYLYVSHEHKDHFDLKFLNSIENRDFTVIVAKFRREELREILGNYHCKKLVSLVDSEELAFADGVIKLFLIDSEINRDSAILVKTPDHTFLNLNDCKLMERLPSIVEHDGPIHVYAAQFSGAIWHPTCYDYPKGKYEKISRAKVRSKFEAVARSLEVVQPQFYLPSAGPACFLDPSLLHLNFEQTNIFPHAPQVIDFLKKRLKKLSVQLPNIMPGDILDVASGRFIVQAEQRIQADNLESYIKDYASLYTSLFQAREKTYAHVKAEDTLKKLQQELEKKLEHLTLHQRITVPLYFRFSNSPDAMLKVDFPSKTIEWVKDITDTNYYSITTNSREMERVFDGTLSWEDFMLSFRMRFNREPDIFQTLMHGFLTMEAEDMGWFCDKLLALETNQERIVVEAGGTRYAINRYCPHEGGDLSQGWIAGKTMMCPRHRWIFDLDNGGKCSTSDCSINAFALDED